MLRTLAGLREKLGPVGERPRVDPHEDSPQGAGPAWRVSG